MRYVLLFAAIMAALTFPAWARGETFVVVNNCPKFTVVNNTAKAAAPKATRIVSASHNCPQCGSYRNIVHRESGVEHSHYCPDCRVEWWHPNPGREQAAERPTYTLPQSTGNCPGGVCPSPTQSRGLFPLFRR